MRAARCACVWGAGVLAFVPRGRGVPLWCDSAVCESDWGSGAHPPACDCQPTLPPAHPLARLCPLQFQRTMLQAARYVASGGAAAAERAVLTARYQPLRPLGPRWAARYQGHLNVHTIKAVTFVGPGQGLVAAGSDCGRLFLWERSTGGGWGDREGGRNVGGVLVGAGADTGGGQ